MVQCQSCGHVYQNPRPPLSLSHRLYPQNYYTLTGRHTQKSSRLIAMAKKIVTDRRLDFFQRQLSLGCNLLEIGCGDGDLLINLKRHYPLSQFTGIDLALSDATKTRCKNQGIRLIKSSVETISLPKKTYDIIIMNQVIEHLWEPALVLKKLHRLLKKGGHLSIETPNLDGYDRKIFSDYWGGYYYPRHLNLFSGSSLTRLLDQTGYRVIMQKKLVAPINWIFSFHAWFKSDSFTDSNPVCLACFSLLDFLAIRLGLTTSNQKIIASVKPRG